MLADTNTYAQLRTFRPQTSKELATDLQQNNSSDYLESEG